MASLQLMQSILNLDSDEERRGPRRVDVDANDLLSILMNTELRSMQLSRSTTELRTFMLFFYSFFFQKRENGEKFFEREMMHPSRKISTTMTSTKKQRFKYNNEQVELQRHLHHATANILFK
jgi:hypothetical protein